MGSKIPLNRLGNSDGVQLRIKRQRKEKREEKIGAGYLILQGGSTSFTMKHERKEQHKLAKPTMLSNKEILAQHAIFENVWYGERSASISQTWFEVIFVLCQNFGEIEPKPSRINKTFQKTGTPIIFSTDLNYYFHHYRLSVPVRHFKIPRDEKKLVKTRHSSRSCLESAEKGKERLSMMSILLIASARERERLAANIDHVLLCWETFNRAGEVSNNRELRVAFKARGLRAFICCFICSSVQAPSSFA